MTQARAVVVALVVLLSLAPWQLGAWGLPGRAGFAFAGLGLVALVVLRLWRRPRSPMGTLATYKNLLVALAAVILTRALSIPGAQSTALAAMQVLRVALVSLFFLLLLSDAEARGKTRAALAWIGLGMIAANLLLFLLAFASSALAPWVLEQVANQTSGTLPRFVGLAPSPFGQGATLLVWVALLRHPGIPLRLRQAATVSGLALSLATISFASLVVPIAVTWRFVSRRRLRAALVLAQLVGALIILYVHPLSLRIGDRRLELQQVHSGYSAEGLGARHMPIQRLELLPGTEIEFHPTAYFYLAKRALSCATEHPLLGVGGRNFSRSCPVTTMSTIGRWSKGRVAHNEWTGVLAEHGLLGSLATAWLLGLLVARLRSRARSGDPSQGLPGAAPVANNTHNAANDTNVYLTDEFDRPWRAGLMLAYLAAGFAGELCFQFPFAALLAMELADPQAARTISLQGAKASGRMTQTPSSRREPEGPTGPDGGAARANAARPHVTT